MGFWTAMFISVLILPVIMIILGKVFMQNAPKEINRVVGYRTAMSMKNKDTWEFAHRYGGKIMHYAGMLALIPSVFAVVLIPDGTPDSIGKVVLVIEVLQFILIIACVIATEVALKNTFRADGSRCRKSLDDFDQLK